MKKKKVCLGEKRNMRNRIRIVGDDTLFQDWMHILTMGTTGSAKTNFNESIACDKWLEGHKVICFDLFKYECCQLGFPTDKELSSIIYNKYPSNNPLELPRAYPHEVLVPFAKTKFDETHRKGEMLINLPKHTNNYIKLQEKKENGGYTYWKPFKLPFMLLEASDLLILLRHPTSAAITATEFLFRSKAYPTIESIMSDVIGLASKEGTQLNVGFQNLEYSAQIGKMDIYQGLLRLLSTVQQSGFLCEEDNPYILDLDSIMQSDEITTFSFANLPDRPFAFMIFCSIMKNILKLRRDKKYEKELILLIPELADFAPSTSSISPEATVEGFSSLTILQILSRHSRIFGITLLCDTQTPQDCNQTVLTNFGWFVIGNSKRRSIDWFDKNIFRLPDVIHFKAENLQTGCFGIIQMKATSSYSYPAFARPCLARHKHRNEDVLGWIRHQKNIENVEYNDCIKSPLVINVMPKGYEKQNKLKEEITEMRVVLTGKDKELKELKKELKLRLKAKDAVEQDKIEELREKRQMATKDRQKLAFELLDKGMKQKDIAKELGVTHQMITIYAKKRKQERKQISN